MKKPAKRVSSFYTVKNLIKSIAIFYLDSIMVNVDIGCRMPPAEWLVQFFKAFGSKTVPYS
jgi:hypothetical protein